MDIITCRYQKENVICSKLTIESPRRHQWCCSHIFNFNFEQISHHCLYFFSPIDTDKCTLCILRHFSYVSYIYLHVQQNQLLSHTEIDGTGGCNQENFILWFSLVFIRDINWRDMKLNYIYHNYSNLVLLLINAGG